MSIFLRYTFSRCSDPGSKKVVTRIPYTRGVMANRTGPIWKWFRNVDMERLSRMTARLYRMRGKGIRPLGGRYPPSSCTRSYSN